MTIDELKLLCSDAILANADGRPAGCREAGCRILDWTGNYKIESVEALASAAKLLLEQLEWHEKRAAQLRAYMAGTFVPAFGMTIPNAVDFAEVHEVAAARIRSELVKLKAAK